MNSEAITLREQRSRSHRSAYRTSRNPETAEETHGSFMQKFEEFNAMREARGQQSEFYFKGEVVKKYILRSVRRVAFKYFQI